MKRTQSIRQKRIRNIVEHKMVILSIIFLVFIELGYIYSFFLAPRTYKSTSRILCIPEITSQVEKSSLKASARPSEMSVYRKRVKQTDILKQVMDNLGLEGEEKEFAKNIKVELVKDTYILEITVTSKKPEEAMKMAREISKVFLEKMKDTYHFEQMGVIDEAKLPTQSSNVHYPYMIGFGLIGMLVAGGYVTAIYRKDNTIKTEEEIKELIGMQTLGTIPKNPKETQWIKEMSQKLLEKSEKNNEKTYLFVTHKPQKGTSYTIASLAKECAKDGKKVLYIDCHLGEEESAFVGEEKGVAEYADSLTGVPAKDFALGKKYLQETGISNLHFLAHGKLPQNVDEFYGSNRMKRVLAIARYLYDLVFVDIAIEETIEEEKNSYLALALHMDALVIFAEMGETKLPELEAQKQEVEGSICYAILKEAEIEIEEKINEGMEKSENRLTVANVIKEGNKRWKKETNENEIFPEGEIVPKANREEAKKQSEIILERVDDLEEEIAKAMKEPMKKIINQKVELFETLQRARIANRQKKQKNGEISEEDEKVEKDFLELKQSMKEQMEEEISIKFQESLEEIDEWNEEWLEELTIRQKEAMMKKLEKKEEAIQKRLQKELIRHLQEKMKEKKTPAKRGRKKKEA